MVRGLLCCLPQVGIGLMFFGVAEPVMHYVSPPSGDPETVASAQQALGLPFPLGFTCMGNLRRGRIFWPILLIVIICR